MPKDKDSALTARLEAAPLRLELAPGSVSDSSLEGSLQSQFLGKAFTLRGFYDDERLHYDSKGNAIGAVHPGSWTTSLFLIQHVKASEHEIELRGSRIAEFYDPKQRKFIPVRTKSGFVSKVDRGASQSNDDVLQVAEGIFLGRKDKLIDLVPEYWRAILSGRVETVPQENGPDCHRIKGAADRGSNGEISIPCEEHAKTKSSPFGATKLDASGLPHTAGEGGAATAPKVVIDTPPEYGDIARALKVQGTLTFEATVSRDGSVSDISVVDPLGFGLDDKAAEAIKTWRFKPALRNGNPVPVRIDVQVNFHLYTSP
jgi:TonB family protein